MSSQLEAMIEEVWEPTKSGFKAAMMNSAGSPVLFPIWKTAPDRGFQYGSGEEPVDLLELAQAVKTAFEPELAKKETHLHGNR